jgi:hypothetical protein
MGNQVGNAGNFYDNGQPVDGGCGYCRSPTSTNIPRLPDNNFDIRSLIPLPITILVAGWEWMMSVSGTDQKPDGVPEEWKAEPGKKDGNTKWVNPSNPHDYVRKKPDGTVTQVRDGKAYDSFGNRVDLKSPGSHGIKPNDFIFRP